MAAYSVTPKPRPFAMPAAGETPVLQAYALAEGITRSHSKSFYLASALLPRAQRRAMRALYAFCRTADEMVDGPDACPALVAEFRRNSRRPAKAQDDPVLRAWADTRDAYDIPQRYAEELLDGVEMDLSKSRYARFAELRRYCYRVASTVGLMSMYITGFDRARRAEAERAATALGIALQLTNSLRDVGEDAQRGRIYLPADVCARHGVSEEDILEGRLTPGFVALMRAEIARAEALYGIGLRGLPLLDRGGRLAVAAAAQLYRGIHGKIAAGGYDVFTRRAQLSTAEKLLKLPGIAWSTYAGGTTTRTSCRA